MEQKTKSTSNKCISYRSLPNLFTASESKSKYRLHRSKSIPSGHYRKAFNKINIEYNRINVIKKKKSDPTIGELLGDDDLFHSSYHHQYSSSRFKRKQYHHRSYIHAHGASSKTTSIQLSCIIFIC